MVRADKPGQTGKSGWRPVAQRIEDGVVAGEGWLLEDASRGEGGGR